MLGCAGCLQLRDTWDMAAEVYMRKFFQEERTTVFVVYRKVVHGCQNAQMEKHSRFAQPHPK